METKQRKQYGFNPNAGQWLKGHLGDRFKACQAIALLGCSKSTFHADKQHGLLVPQMNAGGKPYYLGSQLLQYLAIKQ